MGAILHISGAEWSILFLCIAGVLAAELFNTALEKLCDTILPDQHEGIGHVKDIAAGAVLLTALISVFIGLIIFLPKITSLF